MDSSYLALRLYDQEEFAREVKRKQDEFLDVYSLYLRCRISWVHDELHLKAYELHLLDSSFDFEDKLKQAA